MWYTKTAPMTGSWAEAYYYNPCFQNMLFTYSDRILILDIVHKHRDLLPYSDHFWTQNMGLCTLCFFGSFHVFSPIMSVRRHVVVDVYEIGGVRVVVGDHVEMRVVIRKCGWNVEDLDSTLVSPTYSSWIPLYSTGIYLCVNFFIFIYYILGTFQVIPGCFRSFQLILV